MLNQAHVSAFVATATPIIQAEAARLARRLGLPYRDREDVEQELWLHLWLWCGDSISTPAPGSIEIGESVIFRKDMAGRVRRLADIFARSDAFRRRFGSRRERASSFWMEDVLAAQYADTPRVRQLRLDMTTVVSQLPDELREFCERLSRSESSDALTGSGMGCEDIQHRLAILRRVFREHDLHEYLCPPILTLNHLKESTL